jgi:hypothetical protein
VHARIFHITLRNVTEREFSRKSIRHRFKSGPTSVPAAAVGQPRHRLVRLRQFASILPNGSHAGDGDTERVHNFVACD